MRFKKIVAIIRCAHLEDTETRLKELGIKGITVTHVKGYGEYADFLSRQWMVRHAKIEIFTTGEEVDPIVNTILDAAFTGLEGDGILAILPVDTVYRIRTRAPAQVGEI